MQTEILALKSAFENGCMAFCMWTLLALVAFAVLCATGALRDLIAKWTRLGRVDKAFIILAAAFMTLTGATKGINWSRVYEGGADTGISLVGIYTGISNEVVTAGGVTTTNEIPMVMYMWTGSGASQNTKVSYRFSDTNYWKAVTKTRIETGAEGVTNWVMFATAQNLSNFRYWWLGEDTPAVVITTIGIDITGFSAHGSGVTISWTCEDPRATTFKVLRKLTTDNSWIECGTTYEHTYVVNGFFLDKEWQWCVTSDFLEDGE